MQQTRPDYIRDLPNNINISTIREWQQGMDNMPEGRLLRSGEIHNADAIVEHWVLEINQRSRQPQSEENVAHLIGLIYDVLRMDNNNEIQWRAYRRQQTINVMLMAFNNISERQELSYNLYALLRRRGISGGDVQLMQMLNEAQRNLNSLSVERLDQIDTDIKNSASPYIIALTEYTIEKMRGDILRRPARERELQRARDTEDDIIRTRTTNQRREQFEQARQQQRQEIFRQNRQRIEESRRAQVEEESRRAQVEEEYSSFLNLDSQQIADRFIKQAAIQGEAQQNEQELQQAEDNGEDENGQPSIDVEHIFQDQPQAIDFKLAQAEENARKHKERKQDLKVIRDRLGDEIRLSQQALERQRHRRLQRFRRQFIQQAEPPQAILDALEQERRSNRIIARDVNPPIMTNDMANQIGFGNPDNAIEFENIDPQSRRRGVQTQAILNRGRIPVLSAASSRSSLVQGMDNITQQEYPMVNNFEITDNIIRCLCPTLTIEQIEADAQQLRDAIDDTARIFIDDTLTIAQQTGDNEGSMIDRYIRNENQMSIIIGRIYEGMKNRATRADTQQDMSMARLKYESYTSTFAANIATSFENQQEAFESYVIPGIRNTIEYTSLSAGEIQNLENLFTLCHVNISAIAQTINISLNPFSQNWQGQAFADSLYVTKKIIQHRRLQLLGERYRAATRDLDNTQPTRRYTSATMRELCELINRIDIYNGPKQINQGDGRIGYTANGQEWYQVATECTKQEYIRLYLIIMMILSSNRLTEQQKIILKFVYDPYFNNRHFSTRDGLIYEIDNANIKTPRRLLVCLLPMIQAARILRRYQQVQLSSIILKEMQGHELQTTAITFKTIQIPNLLSALVYSDRIDGENVIDAAKAEREMVYLTRIISEAYSAFQQKHPATYGMKNPAMSAAQYIEQANANASKTHTSSTIIISMQVQTAIQNLNKIFTVTTIQDEESAQAYQQKICKNTVYVRIRCAKGIANNTKAQEMTFTPAQIARIAQIILDTIIDHATNFSSLAHVTLEPFQNVSITIYFNILNLLVDLFPGQGMGGYRSDIVQELYSQSLGLLIHTSTETLSENAADNRNHETERILLAQLAITRYHIIAYAGLAQPPKFGMSDQGVEQMFDNIKRAIIYDNLDYVGQVNSIDVKSTNAIVNQLDPGAVRWARGIKFNNKESWGQPDSVLRQLSSDIFRFYQNKFSRMNCAQVVLITLIHMSFICREYNYQPEIKEILLYMFKETKTRFGMNLHQLLLIVGEVPQMMSCIIAQLIKKQQKYANTNKFMRLKTKLITTDDQEQQAQVINCALGDWLVDNSHSEREQYDDNYQITILSLNHHIEVFDHKGKLEVAVKLGLQHMNIYKPLKLQRAYLQYKGKQYKQKQSYIKRESSATRCVNIYYDFETTCQGRMIPYMVCAKARLYSSKQSDITQLDKLKEQFGFSVIDGCFVADIRQEFIRRPEGIINFIIDLAQVARQLLDDAVTINLIAHNAGRFDCVFLLKAIFAKWGQATQLYGTKTNIKLVVIRGQNIKFMDSIYMTQLGSLNTAAESLGLQAQKLAIEKHMNSLEEFLQITEEEAENMRKYCANDVLMLEQIVDSFNAVMINAINDTIQIMHDSKDTISYDKHWFVLKNSLPGTAYETLTQLMLMPGQVMTPLKNEIQYAIVKASQRGGRTSIMRYDLIDQPDTIIVDIDINSSYPNQMVNSTFADQFEEEPTVINDIQISDNMTLINPEQLIDPLSLYGLSFYDLSNEAVYGWFAVRCQQTGTLFYPRTYGARDYLRSRNQIFCTDDPHSHQPILWVWGFQIRAMQLMLPKAYIQVNFILQRTKQGQPFEFMRHMFAMRAKAKMEKNNPKQSALKLYMNGCYGMMGLKNYPQTTYVPIATIAEMPGDNANKLQMKTLLAQQFLAGTSMSPVEVQTGMAQIQIDEDLQMIKIVHACSAMPENIKSLMVHYVSQITAQAMTHLMITMYQILQQNMTVAYCDTDSLYVVARGMSEQQCRARIEGCKPVIIKSSHRLARDYERQYVPVIGSQLGMWSWCDHTGGKPYTSFMAFAKKVYFASTDQYKHIKMKGSRADKQQDEHIIDSMINNDSLKESKSTQQWQRKHLQIKIQEMEKVIQRHNIAEFVYADRSTRPFYDQAEKILVEEQIKQYIEARGGKGCTFDDMVDHIQYI